MGLTLTFSNFFLLWKSWSHSLKWFHSPVRGWASLTNCVINIHFPAHIGSAWTIIFLLCSLRISLLSRTPSRPLLKAFPNSSQHCPKYQGCKIMTKRQSPLQEVKSPGWDNWTLYDKPYVSHLPFLWTQNTCHLYALIHSFIQLFSPTLTCSSIICVNNIYMFVQRWIRQVGFLFLQSYLPRDNFREL